MGEGLGLEPEMFEMNRMREGEIPGVIDVLANAIHANFEVNLDWIYFSPPQLLTLEPRLNFSSPLSGLSAFVLVLKCSLPHSSQNDVWNCLRAQVFCLRL